MNRNQKLRDKIVIFSFLLSGPAEPNCRCESDMKLRTSHSAALNLTIVFTYLFFSNVPRVHGSVIVSPWNEYLFIMLAI